MPAYFREAFVTSPSGRGFRSLYAQIVIVKRNSGFAGEVDERGAERQECSHEQQRNAIFVGGVEQELMNATMMIRAVRIAERMEQNSDPFKSAARCSSRGITALR